MVNDTRTCQEPGCSGHMIKVGERKTCVFGTSPDETGFTVDVYKCEVCGAEDWL